MLMQGGGKGGLLLWPLFGATNQMLAALSLIVIAVWLKIRKRPNNAFLIPAVFVALITAVGTVLNIQSFYAGGNLMLTAIACTLLLIQFWVIVEGVLSYMRASGTR
jgi:carbon starvation protein